MVWACKVEDKMFPPVANGCLIMRALSYGRREYCIYEYWSRNSQLTIHNSIRSVWFAVSQTGLCLSSVFLPPSVFSSQVTAVMFDDEDNNPYGSFKRRDSNNSDVGYGSSPGTRETWHPSTFPAGPGWYVDMSYQRLPAHPPHPQRLLHPHQSLSRTLGNRAITTASMKPSRIQRCRRRRAHMTAALSRYFTRIRIFRSLSHTLERMLKVEAATLHTPYAQGCVLPCR